ncbi:MAG: morn variant repeat-containing protein [Bacteroidetes bacterium]|nr:MAG: morn variant repeat-containing protein [Bacteroidota bacterium]
MKARQILLPAILLFAVGTLNAQVATAPVVDTVKNKLDAKGRRQGFWKRIDQNGQTIFQGTFKDDKPIGKFEYFDDQGRIMTISHFAPDSKTCRSTHYDANGKKQGEGKYVNTGPGKWAKDSVWRFYNPLGKLVSEDNYVKGLMDGVSKVYFPEIAKVMRERNYKAGKVNGLSTEYFIDGTKKSQTNYVNDKMDGKATWYYPDGRPSVMGIYKNDFKEGTWIYYNQDGSEKFRQVYINGKLQGEEKLITPQEMQKQKQQYDQQQQQNPDGPNLPGGGY